MKMNSLFLSIMLVLLAYTFVYCQEINQNDNKLKSDISIALKMVDPRMELDSCAYKNPYGSKSASSLTSIQASKCLVSAIESFSKTKIIECPNSLCDRLSEQTLKDVKVWSSGVDTNGDFWELALLTTDKNNLYFALRTKRMYKNDSTIDLIWEVK